MFKIKKNCGKIVRKLFPRRIYKLIANGAIIVPSYYRDIIEDAEKNFDQSLEDTDDKALLLMRKYGHVIDKGLHRKDATPGHSKGYYNDLRKLISRLEHSEYANDHTLEWAKNKIVSYEKLQSGDGFVHLEGQQPNVELTFDDFESLVKLRRSNRDFKETSVSDADIDRLKNLANWASSSCNKQPIEIYVTNNTELAKECLKCCKGGTGFSEAIPSFWAFTANIRGYVWPSEIFLPAVDTSLGVQNVMLGATTLGLSATILSWAQKSREDEARLRKLLNIPEHHQIIVCAVMGYANTTFQTPFRK